MVMSKAVATIVTDSAFGWEKTILLMKFGASFPIRHHISLSEKFKIFLIVTLLNKGYIVYMNNWYSSLQLYLYLLKKQTLACDTIHLDHVISGD